MSIVFQPTVGIVAGAIVLIIATELGVSPIVGGVAAAMVCLGVMVAWTHSDRVPNGGGPM